MPFLRLFSLFLCSSSVRCHLSRFFLRNKITLLPLVQLPSAAGSVVRFQTVWFRFGSYFCSSRQHRHFVGRFPTYWKEIRQTFYGNYWNFHVVKTWFSARKAYRPNFEYTHGIVLYICAVDGISIISALQAFVFTVHSAKYVYTAKVFFYFAKCICMFDSFFFAHDEWNFAMICFFLRIKWQQGWKWLCWFFVCCHFVVSFLL